MCLLARQRTTFKWKGIISVFSVLQGSAETLIRWGGKIYHLPIACFLLNTYVKNYWNPTMLARVIAKNVGGVFFETQCSVAYIWTYPRRAKLHLKIVIHWVIFFQKTAGGKFLDSHCRCCQCNNMMVMTCLCFDLESCILLAILMITWHLYSRRKTHCFLVTVCLVKEHV